MAEALGVAASAIQIADIGVKLSQNIYNYVETVATADRRITEIATKIELTTAVVKELGYVFEDPEVVARSKASALATARRTLKECEAIFKDVGEEVEKSKKYKILLPFRTGRFDRLNANLESFKSTLSLLMHFLQHAQQLVSEKELRKQAQELILSRDEAEKRRQQRLPEEHKQVMEDPMIATATSQAQSSSGGVNSRDIQTISGAASSKSKSAASGTAAMREGTSKIFGHPYRPTQHFTAGTLTPSANFVAKDTTQNLSNTEDVWPGDTLVQEQSSTTSLDTQLNSCLDALQTMIYKIELFQGALPRMKSASQWAQSNGIADASSGVKKELDAVMDMLNSDEVPSDRSSKSPSAPTPRSPLPTHAPARDTPAPNPANMSPEPVDKRSCLERLHVEDPARRKAEIDMLEVSRPVRQVDSRAVGPGGSQGSMRSMLDIGDKHTDEFILPPDREKVESKKEEDSDGFTYGIFDGVDLDDIDLDEIDIGEIDLGTTLPQDAEDGANGRATAPIKMLSSRHTENEEQGEGQPIFQWPPAVSPFYDFIPQHRMSTQVDPKAAEEEERSSAEVDALLREWTNVYD